MRRAILDFRLLWSAVGCFSRAITFHDDGVAGVPTGELPEAMAGTMMVSSPDSNPPPSHMESTDYMVRTQGAVNVMVSYQAQHR